MSRSKTAAQENALMRKSLPLFAAVLVSLSAPAVAEVAVDVRGAIGSSSELPPYLQCVPYAREVSGIAIYGDAHTWWQQAEGRYQRGNKPKVGAVMAFRPHGNMTLGHVAAVSKVVDKRTVLLRHANWSPMGGRRGQIENDVKAIDVSPRNDWSQVRVWYAPIADLGTTAWPVEGFIYKERARGGELAPVTQLADGSRNGRVMTSVKAEPRVRTASQTRAAPSRADVIGDIISAGS